MSKLCIFLHFGNSELSEYYYQVLSAIKKKVEFKLIVNIVEDMIQHVDFVKQIFSKFDAVFFITKNKGADLGSFIKYVKAYENYDLVLKLHTKTSNKWRNELVSPLVDNILQVIEKFNDEKVGIVCTNKWLFDLDHMNKNIIQNLCNKWGITDKYYDQVIASNNTKFDPVFYSKLPVIKNFKKINIKVDGSTLYKKFNSIYPSLPVNDTMITRKKNKSAKFVAGTIFMMRTKCFTDFIKKYNINIEEEYMLLEDGYKKNIKPTYTHAWERIISGIVISDMNYTYAVV